MAIQVRRGNLVDLPGTAVDGQPLFTEDTHQLYMGVGSSVVPVEIAQANVRNPRKTVTVTTASLATLTDEDDTLTMAKTFALLKVVADHYCRIRLYSTSAARTADATRLHMVPPDDNIGLITDLYLDTTDKLTWLMSPPAIGFNDDETLSPPSPPTTDIYAKIENLTGGSTTVTVALTFVPMEQ